MEPFDNELLNKLTVLWVFFFTLDALANGIVLSLSNTDWGNLTPTKKVVVVSMILKTWAGVMISLFTQSAARIEKGKSIIPIDDNTGRWARADLPQTPQPPQETKQP